MKTTSYERTYEIVRKAIDVTSEVNEVAEFLENAVKAVTCKEIGIAVYGEVEYTRGRDSKSMSAHLGHILRHLVEGGFVEVSKIDGKPFEYEEEVWVEDNDVPRIIKVHDDEGNTYEIPNPKYNPRYLRGNGHFETVTKTMTPKIKVYKWAD